MVHSSEESLIIMFLCSTNAVALVEEESAECMANGLSDKYSLIYLERLLTCTVLISHLYKNIRW